MENVSVVTDLLQTPRLTRLLRSSGEVFIKAVRTSNAELVYLLLHAGAEADLIWENWVPLVEAERVEIARMLVEAGADLNAKGFGWNIFAENVYSFSTALCMAVRRHDVKTAQYLIGAGADINLPSYYGIPLEEAARENQRELLELLLAHGACVNPVEGFPPEHPRMDALQHAVRSGNLNFVKRLIDAEADVNAPVYHKYASTALQETSLTDHLKMVAFFLNSGTNVNTSGNYDHRSSKTVLTTAVKKNHLKLMQLFLNVDADVNMPSFGDYGSTALQAAKLRPASSEIINLLIAKGARDAGLPRRIDLFKAAYNGDFGRVQLLIDLGVQIDMEMIECDFCPFPNDVTILECSFANDKKAVNMELFRYLLDKVKDVIAQNSASDLTPALIRAIEREEIELVKTLIDAGADVNGLNELNDDYISTPLIAAVGAGNDEMMRFLLRKGADINAIVDDLQTTTALQASLYNEHLNISHFLLANGTRINAPIESEGSSELAYAAATDSIQLVQELLDRRAEVNSTFGLRGRTALQAAARLESANMDMVQLLLERGADVNAPGYITVLQAAAESGYFQIARLFLEAGADINAQALEGSDIRTALETAARYGRLDILYLFLKAEADMHLPIEERFVSAIRFARSKGHIVIAEILEEWDKNGSAPNSKGKERFVELD